jgi:hypothetical protein
VRYFLLKTRALLMNQSYILVIFVLISYTLLGPLSVKFPILGDLKPYHIALAVASIVLCLIIISSPRSVYRSLPILVIRFWGLYLVFLIVITISAFKGLDFGKSYSLWRNYVANLFLVTLVALTIKHERQIAVVLYTLLGITIIGAILGGLQAVASPRISLAYLVGGERWLMEHGFSPVGYAHMPYKFGNDMLVGFSSFFRIRTINRTLQNRPISSFSFDRGSYLGRVGSFPGSDLSYGQRCWCDLYLDCVLALAI